MTFMLGFRFKLELHSIPWQIYLFGSLFIFLASIDHLYFIVEIFG